MNLLFIVVTLIILFIAELLYFKIADHFNIIDKPNHRSSHSSITITGGGIIFELALLMYSAFTGLTYPWFLSGLVVICLISFVDDIRPLSSRVRIIFQLAAVALMFLQLHMFSLQAYWIMLAIIFVIGTINAINFMDGINGITGVYGLVTLGTLYYLNTSISFTDPGLLLVAILSVLVFNFFNFRTKARCFAGDVGSVGLAFIILFVILQLILHTQNLNYFALLLVYGLDTFTTIVFRLIRKENISEAHRSHFYQYWANEKKVSHLIVSAVYGLSQLIINIALLYFHSVSFMILAIGIVFTLLAFVLIRILTEGVERLTKRNYS